MAIGYYKELFNPHDQNTQKLLKYRIATP